MWFRRRKGGVMDVSLEPPEQIRILQRKLYRKAKDEPNYRFYQLYDKIYREDIVIYAYAKVKANDGAPGVDGEGFEEIESKGLTEWLRDIIQELRSKTYKPQPVRRVWIDTPGGGKWPLCIPCINARA